MERIEALVEQDSLGGEPGTGIMIPVGFEEERECSSLNTTNSDELELYTRSPIWGCEPIILNL